MKRLLIIGSMAAALLTSVETRAAPPPANWDGLVQVPSKRLKYVYLQPGADFSGYRSVMLDPTEVAFQKNWQKDYNRSVRDMSGRVSDRDVEQAVREGVTGASDIFAKAWQQGGYTVVNAPGPDVLRVRTAIMNIEVRAPDVRISRSHVATEDAGQAMLVVEVRDSETNALLGRAVDGRLAGDNTHGWRTSMTNRADFRELVSDWAKITVQGMTALKNASPAAR